MIRFYFTFGTAHTANGKPLHDHHVIIGAKDSETAREAMMALYHDKWAFMYSEDKFKPEWTPAGCLEIWRAIKLSNKIGIVNEFQTIPQTK